MPWIVLSAVLTLIALRAHAKGASTAEALQIGRHAGLTSLEPRVPELMAARVT